MLDVLRTATKGWLGRSLMAIVMGFLILSFAIWGIGDIFRGFGADQLAQVGTSAINVDTFRNAYQLELQRLQRQGRRAVTHDEARQLGIDRQVLTQLVSEAAFDQEVRELALAMNDRDIARKVASEDAFKGIDGKFDRQRFEAILRDNGFTELSFIRAQRAQYLRYQVIDSLTFGLGAPEALLVSVHNFQTEARSVDYFILPAAKVGEVPPPSTDELEKYFDARRGAYAVPEYRSLVTLTLTPAALAKPDEVSDQDAMKRYEETKADRFGTPEKREIEQILFTEPSEAEAARARLDAGETWEQLLSEKKLTQKDASLGLLAREGFADKNVAEAAFALPSASVSRPVATQFGSVLLRVTKIEPANIKPFSDVASDLRQEIALQRARREVIRLHDLIEDQRAAGKSLSEAAQTVGLETRVIDEIDQSGKDPKGLPVADIINAPALLKAAFASDIGVDNDTLKVADGAYQWYEVTKIVSARQKTFDEVRQEVEKAWRDDEIAKRLSAKATELAKRVEAGESIAAVAESEGNSEVKHANEVKRGVNQGLAPNFVAQIFNVGVLGTGSVSQADGNRIVFQVRSSAVPRFDSSDPTLAVISGELRKGMAEDVIDQYLTKLENDFGVRVNATAFAAATGAAPNSY